MFLVLKIYFKNTFSPSDSASQVLPVFLRGYLLLCNIDAKNIKTLAAQVKYF